MLNAPPPRNAGTMRGLYVFSHPNSRKITYAFEVAVLHEFRDLSRVGAGVAHRRFGFLPQTLQLLLVVLSEVDLGNDLAQLLRGDGVLVLVVALDDALLVGRQVLSFGHDEAPGGVRAMWGIIGEGRFSAKGKGR